jgi:hypothetical protein
MPRRLEPNEYLVDNDLYTLQKDGKTIEIENVNGGTHHILLGTLPKSSLVRKKFEKYLQNKK